MLLSQSIKILSTKLRSINICKSFLSANSAPKEQTIKVGKYNINYVQVGTGRHHVFCMPGALGTIWTHSKPQVEGLNRELFTIVAWDPVGYGKSRPPDKEFTRDFFEKDADIAYEFLKLLKIPKFSILGWSDGGTSAMILTAKFPDIVNKLVIWGSNSFILPHEVEVIRQIRDVKAWSNNMRQPMIKVYGEEKFTKYWTEWVDGIEAIALTDNGNICSELVKNITCPTFILHGEKDRLVDYVHLSYLHKNIKGSRVHLYPNGKHNIHIQYAEDFNKRVQEFLLQP
ncbi:valacyclovir hydrolase-like [Battus philenor]|uniref:valacyclovir hydrolase-like n=1 Tax=Battus philenor TaxID=42288 RepID=UPI0035CE97DD